MTAKEFEKIQMGSYAYKKAGDEIVIVEKIMVAEDEYKIVENKTILESDVRGQITKFAPDDPESVYVLWPGQTHSERIHYSDLKGTEE